MDRTKFTAEAPGTLVPIATPKGRDWAFVPRPMPPDWEFPNELWPLLAEAKEALGTLNGIGQTLPDPQLLLRPLQSREAIASSRIEGTYVTPAQLLLYELDPRDGSRSDDNPSVNNWREVFNYNRAMKHGWEQIQTLPILNRVIKQMHGILLDRVRGSDKRLGEFRQWQVQLGSSGRFIPPPHTHVPDLMSNLEAFINSDNCAFDPLIRSYIVHYQFETIHPFADGNGRVGRALLALMIYKGLRHSFPWLYMSAFYDSYNDEYIESLFNISARGDWNGWISFCLRGTIAQAKDAIRRCHLFQEAKSRFHGQVGSSSKRTHPLIDHLFVSPVITIPSIQEKFDVTYKTAKKDIECLVNAGILVEFPDEYPRSFFCRDIMKIAYSDTEEVAEEGEAT